MHHYRNSPRVSPNSFHRLLANYRVHIWEVRNDQGLHSTSRHYLTCSLITRQVARRALKFALQKLPPKRIGQFQAEMKPAMEGEGDDDEDPDGLDSAISDCQIQQFQILITQKVPTIHDDDFRAPTPYTAPPWWKKSEIKKVGIRQVEGVACGTGLSHGQSLPDPAVPEHHEGSCQSRRRLPSFHSLHSTTLVEGDRSC